MLLTLLKAKIHRATVTEANLNYIGSITIDEHLLQETGIRENEQVQIVNINNGARFETYVIKGRRGSGEICVNGAAARLVQEGDRVIIICYCSLDENQVATHLPKVVFMNEHNRIHSRSHAETADTLFFN